MLARWLCVFALVATCFPVPSRSQEVDLCKLIFDAVTEQAESGIDFLSLWRSYLVTGEGDQGEEGSDQPGLEEVFPAGTHWVTIDQGTAWAPDCSDGQVRSFYYPPGLIVSAISAVDDYSVLLKTEHGMYGIIDAEHLEPIEPDSFFIFAHAVNGHDLCVNSAVLNPDCDPLLTTAEGSPRLHPIHGYIHGTYRDEIDRKRRLYLMATWRRGMPASEDDRAALCSRFNAGRFYARSSTAQPMPGLADEPGYGMVSMSLCTYANQATRSGAAYRAGIRIVTAKAAKEAFSVSIPTFFMRRANQVINFSKFIEKFDIHFSHRKSCMEALSISNFQTLGGSGGASLKLGDILGFGAQFSMERRVQLTHSFENRMFVISGHVHEPTSLQGLGGFFSSTYDIWNIFGCDGYNVSQPDHIVLYHPLFRDGYFEQNARELWDIYRARHGLRSVPSRLIQTADYTDGYIGRLEDYQDYLHWLQLFRERIEKDPRVMDLQRNPRFRAALVKDPHLYTQLVDHFAHLLLTSSFHSAVEPADGWGP